MWAGMNDIERVLNSMDLFRSRLGSAFNEFDQLSRNRYPWVGVDNYPRTNLYDTGETLELRVEVPGVDKDQMNLKIQGNYLEISGKKTTSTPEGYTVHRTEREQVDFSRSFTLPYEVDTEKVTAGLKDGILTMRLPKSEAAKPKKVTIS